MLLRISSEVLLTTLQWEEKGEPGLIPPVSTVVKGMMSQCWIQKLEGSTFVYMDVPPYTSLIEIFENTVPPLFFAPLGRRGEGLLLAFRSRFDT